MQPDLKDRLWTCQRVDRGRFPSVWPCMTLGILTHCCLQWQGSPCVLARKPPYTQNEEFETSTEDIAGDMYNREHNIFAAYTNNVAFTQPGEFVIEWSARDLYFWFISGSKNEDNICPLITFPQSTQ